MSSVNRSSGSCRHNGVVDDVCWSCTWASQGRSLAVSEPSLGPRERALVAEVLESGRITQGPMVARFESALVAAVGGGVRAVAVSSGTAAVHLALLAAVGTDFGGWRDAEVLVPDLSFVATANAAVYAGARPVLCDIDPVTMSIDLADAARKVSSRTVAIIAVDLFGQRAPLDPLRAFADAHALALVVDAAESFGASGGWPGADAVAFSFYGNKIITTGEGGAVVTTSSVVESHLRKLRGQGQTERRYYHDEVGFNYRMTDLQAALGVAQLEQLDAMLGWRAAVLDVYRREFAKADGWWCLPETAVPWQALVVAPVGVDVPALAAALAVEGVETRPMFVPMHALPMFAAPAERFPIASGLGMRGLALPTSAVMNPEDARLVARMVVQVSRLQGQPAVRA